MTRRCLSRYAGKRFTSEFAPSHKQSVLRSWQRFADLVLNPQPQQHPCEGQRNASVILAAVRVAWVSCLAKRGRQSGYNPLSCAHDMAELAKLAPAGTPCILGRLDFERIAVDMLHLARDWGRV